MTNSSFNNWPSMLDEGSIPMIPNLSMLSARGNSNVAYDGLENLQSMEQSLPNVDNTEKHKRLDQEFDKAIDAVERE